MDLQLAGKTAIVSGGSRGIGKAIARALALEGVDVAIVARHEAELTATATELATETGRRMVPIVADTADDESVRRMVADAAASLGHLDILVNCAAQPGGVAKAPAFDAVTADLLWDDFNVKVVGYLRCVQAVVPHMAGQGWGRIINISGLAARQTGSVTGSIRNVAVVALSKNLADVLGPQGINVNVVHPGATRTETLSQVYADRGRLLGISTAEVEARIAENNSTRHLVDAREVADIVTFLASPRSIAINGSVIDASGGAGGPAIHY